MLIKKLYRHNYDKIHKNKKKNYIKSTTSSNFLVNLAPIFLRFFSFILKLFMFLYNIVYNIKRILLTIIIQNRNI